jgi:hypothetical protein
MTMRYPFTEEQILCKVRLYADDKSSFDTMSTGERIAVALVLDRPDLMEQAWGTMAESVYRLGYEWTESALNVQREGRAQCEEWAMAAEEPNKLRSGRKPAGKRAATPRARSR